MLRFIALFIGLAFSKLLFAGGDNGEISKNVTNPFHPGEHLVYKVSYNLYFNINIGKVDFKIKNKTSYKNGRSCHRIVTKGRTFGFYDPFYKVRDHYETCMNFDKMIPTYFMRDVYEGGYTFKDEIQFYHDANKAVTKNGKEHPIPPKTQDLLSAIYYARTFDFQNAEVGDSALIHTFIDDTTYKVGLKYVGKETIRTKFGKYECLKIKPILIVGRIFDSKYDMTMWVTDDKNKIPLRIESGISVGKIQARLVEYENLKYPFMGGK